MSRKRKSKKFSALYMPASGDNDPSKTGFNTYEEAQKYSEKYYCHICRNYKHPEISACAAEWFIVHE